MSVALATRRRSPPRPGSPSWPRRAPRARRRRRAPPGRPARRAALGVKPSGGLAARVAAAGHRPPDERDRRAAGRASRCSPRCAMLPLASARARPARHRARCSPRPLAGYLAPEYALRRRARTRAARDGGRAARRAGPAQGRDRRRASRRGARCTRSAAATPGCSPAELKRAAGARRPGRARRPGARPARGARPADRHRRWSPRSSAPSATAPHFPPRSPPRRCRRAPSGRPSAPSRPPRPRRRSSSSSRCCSSRPCCCSWPRRCSRRSRHADANSSHFAPRRGRKGRAERATPRADRARLQRARARRRSICTKIVPQRNTCKTALSRADRDQARVDVGREAGSVLQSGTKWGTLPLAKPFPGGGAPPTPPPGID